MTHQFYPHPFDEDTLLEFLISCSVDLEQIASDKNHLILASDAFDEYSFDIVQYQRYAFEQAIHFNVFEILNIQSLEARVHTPFIAHLLDPNGSHQLGRLFLNNFLVLLQIAKNETDAERLELVSIVEEMGLSNENGRADIFMKFSVDNNTYAIIIENKIYAGDQNKQLARYNRYMKKELNLSDDSYKLVYLTLYNQIPSSDSIQYDELLMLKQKNCYININYKQDIINWLYHCIKTSPEMPKKIETTLIQYIQTIKNL